MLGPGAQVICRTLAAVTAGVALAVLPACAQTRGGETVEGEAVDSARVARMIGGDGPWRTDFSRISVPPGEIVSGGPPKDGIPAIDRPRFEAIAEADGWLEDEELVMVVEHGAEVKAYPLQILIWHEIVNDEVGGKPLTITFCPLCNTALVFERVVDGRVLDFGTTGSLRQSDLVMYDRQTESWWQQATGEAIVGEYTGTLLELYPANTLAWVKVRQLYPEAHVLSRDTGHRRSYGRNPYVGYDTQSGPIRGFFRGRPDPRFPAMERVVGLSLGSGWAVPFSELARVRVVNAEKADRPFVVLWESGAASALDASRVSGGRDVGQSAVFDRRLGEHTLTFEWRDGAFRDLETGSTWNLAGRAVGGSLEGQRLRPIPHGNHFWFAWITFMTETEVWQRP